MFDPEPFIKALLAQGVSFVIVGGIAAHIHGSEQLTNDFDLCYARSTVNMEAIVRALAPLHPKLRGEGLPDNLPFVLDVKALRMGLNFTLSTDLGDIDLLGEVSGVGDYAACASVSETFELYGVQCSVLGLDALIRSKQAASRPKDIPMILELEAIREIKSKGRYSF